jgi:ribonuclease E
MPNKMLIDASHPEETRVVVVRGNRIEEFDFESQDKKQLKGNIYLARVTRVEPSLQAAFIEYGGNRHGFLAFSEIHPDYYQIPVADRQALLRAEAEDAEDEDDDEDEERGSRGRGRRRRGRGRDRDGEKRASYDNGDSGSDADSGSREGSDDDSVEDAEVVAEAFDDMASEEDGGTGLDDAGRSDDDGDEESRSGHVTAMAVATDVISEEVDGENGGTPAEAAEDAPALGGNGDVEEVNSGAEASDVESVGADDAVEEVRQRSRRFPRKQYKIQEVIKRRQILLVQVVKEERGNKGAALTTYLSLAGRYSVLMPNTARGGGISRKITNASDRKRLKDVVKDLDVPQGMGVILRTAGESRTKAEIKRDYEYLMRLWENVRTLTLQSTAPALVYEEGSLIKRSVRDLYNKDIDDIQVAGEEGYREAKDFMRMLMPSHAKVVQPYRDPIPLFVRHGVESQLDRMLQPQVTLKSGGYIIINQTEALVSIDVNSGRSTREHSIEDTALQTNLEAADEVARQLRLRDLAGLIVIDFIDMEENRNNRAVEKRMKDCLKNDRARIQVGRISHFGLLEMSRQRIRASVLESTMQPCPHCGGTGHVRSDSSVALLVLRAIEEFLLKDSRYHLTVKTPMATALYVLNHKRRNLADLEVKFGLSITIEGDETVGAQHYAIFKGALVDRTLIQPAAPQIEPPLLEPEDEDVVEIEAEDDEEVVEASEARPQQQNQNRERDQSRDRGDDGEGGRRRRRRRRRRGGRDRDRDGNGEPRPFGADAPRQDTVSAEAGDDFAEGDEGDDEDDAIAADGQPAAEGERQNGDDRNGDDRNGKRRRRGKRGGRRNRHGEDGFAEAGAAEGGETDGEVSTDASDAAPVIEAGAVADLVTEEPATEALAEPAAEAEKPVRRSRKKASEDGEAKPARSRSRKKAADAVPAAEIAVDTPAAISAEDARPIEIAAQPEAPVEAEAAPPAQPAAPAEPVVTSSGQPDAPRKGGWWQRRGFF